MRSKLPVLATLPLAAVIACAGGAGVAHAETFSGSQGDNDANALAADEHNAHITGDTGLLSNMAQEVCNALRNGKSESAIIAAAAAGPPPQPLPGTTYMVHASEWHYCPDFYHAAG